jgi:hypothetical protein
MWRISDGLAVLACYLLLLLIATSTGMFFFFWSQL